MKYLMLDTCVWWNLSTDHKEKAILVVLQDLVESNEVRLIVPDIVKDEIARNRTEIKTRLANTYRAYSKHSKTLSRIFNIQSEEFARVLSEIDELIEDVPENIETNLKIVEALINNTGTMHVAASEAIKCQVVEMGLNKSAPFHRSKNSVADAMIAEEFRLASETLFKSGASWVAFVTDNKSDFSDPKNPTKPHSDLNNCLGFDQRVSYSINIAEVLNSIKTDSIPNEVVQHVRFHPGYRELFCEHGGNHEFVEVGWRPAAYGGRSWQLRCEKCGLHYDTGEIMED